jgi:TusE/DsrC/DsvC family sulfur relay protein
MKIDVNGQLIDTDEQGYLVNLEDWNQELATYLAEKDELQLTGEHWEVIDLMRDYYQEHHIAPAMRVLTKVAKEKLGKDKADSKYLYSLFPYGPAKQAARYAGLPKPTGCV